MSHSRPSFERPSHPSPRWKTALATSAFPIPPQCTCACADAGPKSSPQSDPTAGDSPTTANRSPSTPQSEAGRSPVAPITASVTTTLFGYLHEKRRTAVPRCPQSARGYWRGSDACRVRPEPNDEDRAHHRPPPRWRDSCGSHTGVPHTGVRRVPPGTNGATSSSANRCSAWRPIVPAPGHSQGSVGLNESTPRPRGRRI